MEEGRQTLRPSGVPRMSRLPLPRTSAATATTTATATGTGLRPSPSRQLLAGSGEIRNPKLRATPSRDRLAPSKLAPTLRRKDAPTQPSRLQPNLSRKPSSSFIKETADPLGIDAPSPRQSSEVIPAAPREPPTDVLFKRSLTLTRRPSEVFSNTPVTPAKDPSDYGSLAPAAVESPSTTVCDDIPTFPTFKKPARLRPSLSERTIETLSQLPSSPALRNKSSAFFDPGSARRSPPRPASRSSRGSRPGSSYQSDGSNRPTSRDQSRPESRSGQGDYMMAFRSSTNAYKPPLGTLNGNPSSQDRASATRTLRAPASRDTLRSSARKLPTPSSKPPPRSKTPSPEKRADFTENKRPTAKTMASRPLKARPSLNGLFKKPSVPAFDKPAAPLASRKASLVSQKSSAASSDDTNQSLVSPTSTAPTASSSGSPSAATSRKSSAALREQIAKAKAAKRAAARPSDGVPSTPSEALKSPLIPTDDSFDFGLSDNPFGQRRSGNAKAKVVEARLGAARTSGRLNFAALGLREIPPEVLKMYDLSSIGTQNGSWAESVDLTRFIAADNELEIIDESIFPDRDPQDFADDEDGPGSIFGGLETLDLHGNMLITLPTGLRRLHHLSSLNLASNRISNPSLELISQITSLRDLKLGSNLFYGPLDPVFSNLVNLEILDLHGNNISALPEGIVNLTKLRILNLSENSFEQLRFDLLSKLPLTELLVRKNKLSGVLIDESIDCLPHMQTLDVSSNQLTRLISPDSGKSLSMPSLHQLCLSMNRLQGLPDLSTCPNLLTLTADENSINAVPEGLITLSKLRHVDFSSNDIRVVPPEIARMDNLAMLRLSGNPLRDKKFCSITTEELKVILAGRLEPEPEPEMELEPEPEVMRAPPARQRARTNSSPNQDDSRSDNDDFATPPTSAPGSPARSRSHTVSSQIWTLKAGGVLDRSSTQSSSLHPVVCARLSSEHRVREVQLHHNLFSAFPESLSFFAESLTSLSLAHNQLVGESYMGGVKLELPALTELNLSSNHITGLSPLLDNLVSPRLQKLDVSVNRISALPVPGSAGSPSGGCSPSCLKDAFPQLTVLLIANNHLAELDPESVRGLRIVDASNNDIAHLNPRLGLLGGGSGPDSLERLEVMGNRFRVPRFNVLERGTEATLRWLRGRVPVAEMAQWRKEGGASGSASGDDQENDGFD